MVFDTTQPHHSKNTINLSFTQRFLWAAAELLQSPPEILTHTYYAHTCTCNYTVSAIMRSRCLGVAPTDYHILGEIETPMSYLKRNSSLLATCRGLGAVRATLLEFLT